MSQMKKINLSIKEPRRNPARFSVQKNITFSNSDKVARKLSKPFKNIKEIRF